MPRRALDISGSARLFAAVDLSIADTAIAVWNGKFKYGSWRPIPDGYVVEAAWEPGRPSFS